MIETWFGPLTKEIFESLMILFCIGVVGSILIGMTGRLLGAKGKKKSENDPTMVVFGITAIPILEELIFRGPIFVFFSDSTFGWLLVILWGGLFFGIGHAFPRYKEVWEILPNRKQIITSISAAGFIGIVLSLLVINTKSLIAAMILHGLFNAYAFYASLVTEKTKKT